MGKREEYIDKLAAQLKDWGATIDELAAKTELQVAERKNQFMKEIRYLKQKELEAQAKLRVLKGTTGEAWNSLTTGMDKAWSDLSAAVKEAADKLKQPR